MNTKAVNRLFLVSLIVEAAVILFLQITGIQLGTMSALIVNQLILLLPALAFLALTKTKPGFIVHNRIKPVTPVLCVVFTGLCMPLIMVVNMISMLFVDNAANQLVGAMMDIPAGLIVLVVGILGPMNEEFLYRGIFYHSYRKNGRILAALFMSSFLFGLMHLNLNQMSYAIVMGIMSVLLVEATGNIVSSMIFHACINTYNVIVMVIQQKQLAVTGGDSQALLDESLAQLGVTYHQFLLISILMFGIIAVAATTLAVLLLYGMAVIEQRQKEFICIFKRKQGVSQNEKKESLWTASLIIAVVLCVLYMIAQLMFSVI